MVNIPKRFDSLIFLFILTLARSNSLQIEIIMLSTQRGRSKNRKTPWTRNDTEMIWRRADARNECCVWNERQLIGMHERKRSQSNARNNEYAAKIVLMFQQYQQKRIEKERNAEIKWACTRVNVLFHFVPESFVIFTYMVCLFVPLLCARCDLIWNGHADQLNY